jgi:response regulator RpfG family c-di-GMP phosphodiesterase
MSDDRLSAIDSLHNVHVLVVEDDRESLAAVAAVLRHCGALVIECASDDHAFRVVDQVRPDAIVVVMPRRLRHPVPLIARLRARKPEDGGVIPIVVIADERDTVEREGVSAWITRPVDPWRLCFIIAALVGRR